MWKRISRGAGQVGSIPRSLHSWCLPSVRSTQLEGVGAFHRLRCLYTWPRPVVLFWGWVGTSCRVWDAEGWVGLRAYILNLYLA